MTTLSLGSQYPKRIAIIIVKTSRKPPSSILPNRTALSTLAGRSAAADCAIRRTALLVTFAPQAANAMETIKEAIQVSP